MTCKHYGYQQEVVGSVGGCKLGLFGGLHALNCLQEVSKCPSFEKEVIMTKQEEIKEGIEQFVSEAYWYEGEKNMVADITSRLLSYLHSQGVVIKVGKELPREYAIERDGLNYINGFNACVEATQKAGLVFVEPLIKEEVHAFISI